MDFCQLLDRGVRPVKAHPRNNERIVTPELQAAHDAVADGQHVLVLGSGGTGKSEFLKEVRRNSDRSLAVAAFMGRAALNVEGTTIHRFFRFETEFIDAKGLSRSYRPPLTLFALQLLIIDEISMVRADLFDAIDVALRIAQGKLKVPFGGVQVLALGDHLQLTPIVKPEEGGHFMEKQKGYTSPWFFDAHVFRCAEFAVVEFTRVFRQSNAEFIALLDRLRRGIFTDDDLDALNAAHVGKPLPEQAVTLVPYRETAALLNAARLAKLSGPSAVYEVDVTGKWGQPPVERSIRLKLGARVMCTVNRQEENYVNGTLGTVSHLGDSSIVIVTDDGREIRVDPYTWQRTTYAIDRSTGKLAPCKGGGEFTQLPLTLAWAISIHKSQGATFNEAIVDLDRGAFADGQAYVALSRVRDPKGLSLAHPVRRTDFRVNHQAAHWEKWWLRERA
jgi:hypothetical protein